MQIKTKLVSSHTADPKAVKQEVNGTVILPPLVFPGLAVRFQYEIYSVSSQIGVPSICGMILHCNLFVKPNFNVTLNNEIER